MKKILIVTNTYYPHEDSISNLAGLIAEKFKREGYEVIVLTGRYIEEDLYEEEINGIKVYRNENDLLLSNKEILKTKRGVWIKISVKAFAVLFSKINYDESSWIFSNIFYRSICRVIKREQVHKVVTVVGYSGLYRAMEKIKNRYKSNIEWIIYQVDPYTENVIQNKWAVSIRKFMEYKFYNKADIVIMLPEVYKRLGREFREQSEKFFKLDFPNIVPIEYREGRKREGGLLLERDAIDYCFYIGSLQNKCRNMNDIYQIFSLLESKNIIFGLIGLYERQKVDLEKRKKVDDKIPKTMLLVERLKRDACLEYMDQADVLINVGNMAENLVPSKLFDYISSGKPIINYYTLNNDPSKDYLDRYPYVLNICAEERLDVKAQKIYSFIQKYGGKCVEKDELEKLYEGSLSENVLTELYHIINKD